MIDFLNAALIATCALWILVTMRAVRDAVAVFRFFSQARPGFKSYILFQILYFTGGLILGGASLSVIFIYREEVLANPIFVFGLLFLGLIALLADHLYRKALAGSEGVPDLLMINQYFIYLSENKKKKLVAEKLKEKVPAKYLERSTLKARVLLPTVRFMKLRFGEERTKEIFAELETPIEYVLFHDSDINIEFSNDLFSAIMRETDRGPDVIFESQASGANLECMGAMFFLVAKLLSISHIYKTICRLSKFLDENFTNEVVDEGENWMQMRCYFKAKTVFERVEETCIYSVAGWISSVPHLKGLPQAEVEVMNSPFSEQKVSDDYFEFKIRWVQQLSDAVEVGKMVYDSSTDKKK